VRRRPYSVILFDEVEKAHVSVFNTLLQVLDDGRLTDGQGRTVDFRNTVIIMTSNLGAEHLLAGMVGKNSMKVARDLVMQEVCDSKNPELSACFQSFPSSLQCDAQFVGFVLYR
jgi:ATP-dependent Clp protease ATP-binding subunit ClpB